MYSLEEFLRFNILQVSRVFDYDSIIEDSSVAVPFADMFNHSFDDNTKYQNFFMRSNFNQAGLNCVSLAMVRKGQNLFLNLTLIVS